MSITAEKIAKIIDGPPFSVGEATLAHLSADDRQSWVQRKNHALAKAEAILALLQQGEPEGWKPDYFSFLVVKARAAAHKACKKFPQPNYVLLKVSEEAGEVVRAGVHYIEKRMPWEEVEGEIVQLLAMVFRLVTEGDQVNGLTPPPEISSSASPLPPAPGAETGERGAAPLSDAGSVAPSSSRQAVLGEKDNS